MNEADAALAAILANCETDDDLMNATRRRRHVDSVECPAWRRRPGTFSRVGGESRVHGLYEPPL